MMNYIPLYYKDNRCREIHESEPHRIGAQIAEAGLPYGKPASVLSVRTHNRNPPYMYTILISRRLLCSLACFFFLFLLLRAARNGDRSE